MDVRIEPVRLEWIEALAEGDAVFTERFAIDAAPGWIGFPEAMSFALDAARSNDRDPWGSYLFFDTDGTLVGFGGFKGQPVDGQVEIGYAVAPSRQGRGIAAAAATLMIERAREANVEVVLAHTLAEVGPSTAVLVRCQFVNVGTVVDPDGHVEEEVWCWERRLH